MTADRYLASLITKYAVDIDAAQAAANKIAPIINDWANGYLLELRFSGSIAKGTAVSISTDADIFISLSSTTPSTLSQIFHSLHAALTASGYSARAQNVSIGLTVNRQKIDLVPGRRQSQFGSLHSLYRSKADSWTQTDVASHVSLIAGSNRTDENKVLKIWRQLHALPLPSFFLELMVIGALHGARIGTVAENVWTALAYVRDHVQVARCVDPANSNNIVSDDCTSFEKSQIATAAARSCAETTWERVVW